MMLGSYVGIDLGATTVRAVRLRRTLKGLEVQAAVSRQFASAPGDLSDTEEALIDCLQQLRAEGWGRHERVVVAVPEAALLARKLDLPFTDPGKVSQVVPFELESLLPFCLEDVVIDYEMLARQEERSSALGMAVPKDVFERRLDLLSKAGISVWRVAANALALRAHYDRFIKDDGGPVVLMHIEGDGGAPMLTLCALEARRLCEVRTILGSRQGPASPVALTSAHPVLAEVRRTLRVWGQEGARPFSRLYLSGQGSAWPGIQALLAETTGIQEITIVGSGPREEDGTGSDPCLVIAAGLAAMGGERQRGRLDFARGRHRAAVLAGTRTRWGALAVGLCLVLALTVTSFLVHYRAKESRYHQISAAVSALYQEAFHEAGAGVDEPSRAKSLLVEAQKRGSFLGATDLTVTQVLTQLTSHIPKDAHMEIRELAIEGGRLWIEAETDSFESLDRIKNELGRAPRFGDVSVSDARVGPASSGIHFRLQLVLGHR